MDEPTARAQIVECCRRMHERGLISGGEGNVSIRLARNRVLVTPSGVNKGFLKPEDLVVVDFDARVVKGKARASSEVRMHLAAYRVRPEVGAVVHAHPPTAVAFTIAGVRLAQCVIPEAIVTLGEVGVAPYVTPTTEALAAEVERLLVSHDVVMMDRHGSVTLGRDVFEAYDRLEALEHTARITFMARALGPLKPLPPDEVARLRAIGRAMGWRSDFSGCEGCNVCRGGPDGSDEALISAVVQRVLARLAK